MPFCISIFLKLEWKDGLSNMQVILTEDEYVELKMGVAKQSTPDHVALQNCVLKTIENFKEFCNQAKIRDPSMWITVDPEHVFNDLVQAFENEVKSHFVR